MAGEKKQNQVRIIKGTEHTEEFDQKKLDRPDREKIKEVLYSAGCPSSLEDLKCDQIIALIEPLIEEAVKQERERIIKDIRSILVKSDDLTIFLSRMEYYFKYLEALKGGGILLASAKVNKNIPINIPSNEVESDIELGVNDD